MADLVDVLIEDKRWHGAELNNLAQKWVPAVLSHFDLAANRYSVSVLGCDDKRIATLNTEFRDKPVPTNVLSWPALDLPRPQSGRPPQLPRARSIEMLQELGDIAISFDTCVAEAEKAGIDIQAHVAHLLVHSTLHLLGYDHIVTKDAVQMEGLERQVLAAGGLPDPYDSNQRH